MTERTYNQIGFNRLTKAQYNELAANDQINPLELYFIIDDDTYAYANEVYTKDEIDQKFNDLNLSGSLATVATTGSYNDLTDKPNIPSIEGLATTSYVDGKITDLINEAPEKFDTLKEIAEWIGDDTSGAQTVINQVANKADKSTTYTKTEVDTLINNNKGTEVIANQEPQIRAYLQVLSGPEDYKIETKNGKLILSAPSGDSYAIFLVPFTLGLNTPKDTVTISVDFYNENTRSYGYIGELDTIPLISMGGYTPTVEHAVVTLDRTHKTAEYTFDVSGMEYDFGHIYIGVCSTVASALGKSTVTVNYIKDQLGNNVLEVDKPDEITYIKVNGTNYKIPVPEIPESTTIDPSKYYAGNLQLSETANTQSDFVSGSLKPYAASQGTIGDPTTPWLSTYSKNFYLDSGAVYYLKTTTSKLNILRLSGNLIMDNGTFKYGDDLITLPHKSGTLATTDDVGIVNSTLHINYDSEDDFAIEITDAQKPGAATRIDATASHVIDLQLPSKNGTFALLSDIDDKLSGAGSGGGSGITYMDALPEDTSSLNAGDIIAVPGSSGTSSEWITLYNANTASGRYAISYKVDLSNSSNTQIATYNIPDGYKAIEYYFIWEMSSSTSYQYDPSFSSGNIYVNNANPKVFSDTAKITAYQGSTSSNYKCRCQTDPKYISLKGNYSGSSGTYYFYPLYVAALVVPE